MTKPERYGPVATLGPAFFGLQPNNERRAVKMELRPPAATLPAKFIQTDGEPDREGLFQAFATMAPKVGSMGIYVLRDCEVRGLAFTFLDGKLVDLPDLIPSYVRHDVDRGQQSQLNDQNVVVPIPGTALVFVSNAYQIYGHWLLDILPRLWIAQNLLNAQKDVRLLIPNGTPTFAIEIMRDFFGVLFEFIHDLDRENLLIERVLVPSLPHNDHFFHPLMNEFVGWLINHPLVVAASMICTNTPEMIYISRKKFRDLSTSYVRSISNENEVFELVLKLGFYILSPEEYSWRDQILLFSRARVVVGEDGSGLHNAIFSASETAVVCLNPANQVQISIAALRGHSITVLCSPSIEEGGDSRYTIDMQRFRLAITSAMESVGISIPSI